MKTYKALLIIATLTSTFAGTAQNALQLKDATIEYDGAQRACIKANLDPEPKTLKKAWKSYLKDNYDFKIKGIGFLTNKDLLYKEETVIPQLSSKQLDFYTRIIEAEQGSEMKVFVRYGYDIYLTETNNPSEYRTLNSMITGFLKSYLPTYYKDQKDDTEKRIKNLTAETEDLKEEIADDSNEIDKLEKEIEQNEVELETKQNQLETTKFNLKQRNEKIKSIKSQLSQL